MMLKLIALAALLTTLSSGAQIIKTERPVLAPLKFSLDSVPESELNVPIQIDLKPFFAMADKKVDTLFTSPKYPNEWVQEGCDTRYKYSFRRSPLRFDFTGNKITIAFTGFYKIVGSTRGCVNGVAVTPWTPECKCGFDEGERRVNISYTITPAVQVNYIVRLNIVRNEPVAVDKCTVCFWGHDITPTIMSALKKELDISKNELIKSYGTIDLKPQFQKIWHQLNTPYNVNGYGWLQINPQKVRLNQLYGVGDKLNINIGLAAKPVVRFEKPNNPLSAIPDITSFSRTPGFNINVDAVLNYDSLSNILNKQIVGKEYSFSKAFIKKKFIFKECRLMGSNSDRLIIEVNFTGTDNGVFYLTAKPIYDPASKTLSLANVEFDIKTRDALLKTADWLFSRKITSEIEKTAKYDLTAMMADASATIGQQLNRDFIKGVKGNGKIASMSITKIYPKPEWLILRANALGNFSLIVRDADLSF